MFAGAMKLPAGMLQVFSCLAGVDGVCRASRCEIRFALSRPPCALRRGRISPRRGIWDDLDPSFVPAPPALPDRGPGGWRFAWLRNRFRPSSIAQLFPSWCCSRALVASEGRRLPDSRTFVQPLDVGATSHYQGDHKGLPLRGC